MLIIHIGLPKTGTTFLQRRIFAKARDLQLVHIKKGPEALAICNLMRDHAVASRVMEPILRQRIRKRIQQLDTLSNVSDTQRKLLISYENISVRSGGFWRGTGSTPSVLSKRLALLANQLSKPLHPVRILIGTRRQDHWLASRYAETARHEPGFCQADFDARMENLIAGDNDSGPTGWLDYASVTRHFCDAFGHANVFILPLEAIEEHPRRVFADLQDFTGSTDLLRCFRKSRKRATAAPKNQLKESEMIWRLKKHDASITLHPEISAAILEKFATSNAAMAGVVGTPQPPGPWQRFG